MSDSEHRKLESRYHNLLCLERTNNNDTNVHVILKVAAKLWQERNKRLSVSSYTGSRNTSVPTSSTSNLTAIWTARKNRDPRRFR